MTSDAPAPGAPARAWPLLVGCALVAGAKLLLVADDELVARSSPLDQLRFLEMANALLRGAWLGPWDALALVREPGYSLWLAAVHQTGVPLRVATEVALLASAGLFCGALRRAGASQLAAGVAFALIALEPHSLVVNRDALPAGFYLPVLLCALAGLTFALAARTRRGLALHAAWAGLCLGALWCTRPEKLALLPLLAVPALWELLIRWRRFGARGALARAVTLLAAAGAGTACVAVGVAAVNRAHYGVFATTAVTAPGYLAANRALTGIEQPAPRRFVPIPADVRERAYAVSPAFRELRPVIESPSWARVVSCNVDGICDDIGAGYFRWLFREAAASAGHFGSAAEADAYFARIAAEIGAACGDGRLSCRSATSSFLHPVSATWLPHVGESAKGVLDVAFRGRAFELFEQARDRPNTPAAVRRLFDDVANRRPERTGNGNVRITGRVVASGEPVTAIALWTRFTRVDAELQPSARSAQAPGSAGFSIAFDKSRRNFDLGESRLVFARASGAALELPLARVVAGNERVGDLEVEVSSFVETQRESALRRKARWALWSVHPVLYAALVVLAALSAAVLLLPPRRGRFATPVFGAVLLVATFVAVRVALLVLVDASSFPTRSSRYVYPAVPLAGCLAVLLIDQARRVLQRRPPAAPD